MTLREGRPNPMLTGYLELRKQEYTGLYDRWCNDPQPYDLPPSHWPSAKSMLNRFPHELHLLIFRYLYQADLFHLALTCRHLADLAIPHLYACDIAEFDCLSLRWACTFSVPETLDRALSHGASVNHQFDHGTAVDCTWVIRDPDFHECLFNTPLKLAIFTDDVLLVRTLCQRGADVNAPDSYSVNCYAHRLKASYPLHHTMDDTPRLQPGNPRIVQALLEAGADPNQYTGWAWRFYNGFPYDSPHELPLGLAMQPTVPAETVQLLLQHGADPLLKGKYSVCQRIYHYTSRPDVSSAVIMTDIIRNVYPSGLHGELTPLMAYLASRDRDTWSFDEEKVRLLLQHGAGRDAQLIVAKLASDHESPWFDMDRTPEVFRIFALSLSETPGLDMVSFSQREISPFLAVIRLTDRWITHCSTVRGLGHRATDFLQITSDLLRRMGEACETDGEPLFGRHSAAVDARDSASNYNSGWFTSDLTALRWLCLPFGFLGSATVIPSLLAIGADVNRRDSEGMTPLHLAAMFASGDRVRPLVEFLGGPEVSGLTIDARDVVGWTPLHFASFFGLSTQLDEQVRAARLLLDNGADIHAQTMGGWTPLSLAVKNANLELVRFLLERGAHPKDMFGPPGYESLRAKMFFCRCLAHSPSGWRHGGALRQNRRRGNSLMRRVNELRRFAAAAGSGDDEHTGQPPLLLSLPRYAPQDSALHANLRAANIFYEHETLSLRNPFTRNSPALDSWAELIRSNVDEYAAQVLRNLTHNMTTAMQAQFCSRDGIYYDQAPTLGVQCVRMCHVRDDDDDDE
ncbi:putative ankyrin [Cercophora samala]|uniref:Ankyrin n=1 Tax=Cercophora samala TaxID=330535 RepID=A0AA39ZLB2_9PEZI|nr:putative ankyrin [Cercophora samala]